MHGSYRASLRWRLLAIVGIGCLVLLTASNGVTPLGVMTIQSLNAGALPAIVSVPSDAPVPDWPVPGVVSRPKPVRIVPAAAPPLRMIIPRLGVDTKVVNLPISNPAEGMMVNPPQSPEGFWLNLWGMPGAGSTDMTVISGHSCVGLAICQQENWQFTKLSNHAVLGDRIDVRTVNGIVHYTVDQIFRGVPRADLTTNEAIYGTSAMPCRLIVVTCDTRDVYVDNYVVTAKRESCH